jgi:hypothetical protein
MGKAECVVTTEKDATKLNGVLMKDFPIMSLAISLRIMEGDHFKRTLLDLLEARSN